MSFRKLKEDMGTCVKAASFIRTTRFSGVAWRSTDGSGMREDAKACKASCLHPD